ncbi:MAG: peptide chain release factor N(5)-glutamine methyltransferase [Flavobacteriales bacterium]|nr:peptide chain release factor N(5)-glutamine methyltransferase [Flavobacteriales bacterium]
MEKVSNILSYFREELSAVADEREITSWYYISMEYLLVYNRSDCIINSNQVLNKSQLSKIKQIVAELKTHKPIQYILGKTEFYGLKIKVNEHTLIPRPETEQLVDWILKENFVAALDIGTGSGCIPIALAKNTDAKVLAIDVSEDALLIAEENAKNNEVEIDFIHQDILQTNYLQKVDLIVSNPPYVLESEKEKMQENVLDYEPELALFVEDKNPLIFYKKIASLAFNFLNENGKLFFEINAKFGKETIEMLADIGFVNIELKKDMNDKDRMIKAIKK